MDATGHVAQKVDIGFLNFLGVICRFSIREKGRNLTHFYDKTPYTHRKIQKATWQHKTANKNFDYTTIADRLRTVSWGNDNHPTCVVKLVYGTNRSPD